MDRTRADFRATVQELVEASDSALSFLVLTSRGGPAPEQPDRDKLRPPRSSSASSSSPPSLDVEQGEASAAAVEVADCLMRTKAQLALGAAARLLDALSHADLGQRQPVGAVALGSLLNLSRPASAALVSPACACLDAMMDLGATAAAAVVDVDGGSSGQPMRHQRLPSIALSFIRSV